MRFNIDKNPTQSTASLDDLAKKFDEMNAEIEAKRQEFQRVFSEQLSHVFKTFFELAPKIKSVCWTQYTPYFMDGDECVFGLNSIFFSTDVNEDFETYPDFNDGPNDWSCESYSLKQFGDEYLSSEQKKACDTLEGILGQNQDVLKEILGDHLKVRVTREGIETEHYNHD